MPQVKDGNLRALAAMGASVTKVESVRRPDPSRVSDALAALGHSHPSLERLWPHLAVALDGQLVSPDAPLHPGSELALLPPVSGG